MWHVPYRSRAIMLFVFNVLRSLGYHRLASWVPTLVVSRGIMVTNSLLHTFIIALANPTGPLLASFMADRIHREWQLVGARASLAISGIALIAAAMVACYMVIGIVGPRTARLRLEQISR